jgi:hypothetical protein
LGAPDLSSPDFSLFSLLGCDFSSSPSKRKPIVVASGALHPGCVQLKQLHAFDTLASFQDFLHRPAPAHLQCVGAFDLPFGLPRQWVETMQWPTTWPECMDRYAAHSRDELRQFFKSFCDARPAGAKFAHRATDGPAGASPSMKWVNPPVAWMMHAGVPLLRKAQWTLPGLEQGRPNCVALEAYPGLLAREMVGHRSYKSDDKQKQTPERWVARKDILHALDLAQTRLNLRLKLTASQHDTLLADASGDSLDAVLCMVQAGWAATQHTQAIAAGKTGCYGLPAFDPLEGWIVSA